MRVVRGLVSVAQLICVFFVLCGFASSGLGQAPTGTVEGTVADRDGLVLAAAHLELTDRSTGAHRELEVASGGRFQFAALPIGDYSLRIESTGFAAYVEEQIHLSVSESSTRSFMSWMMLAPSKSE